MLYFVAGLSVATLASSAWCARELLLPRLRTWWQTSRRIGLSGIALLAILVVAAQLRFVVVPAHHAMYLDEPWYAEAACNLWRFRRLVLCEETWSGPACVPFEKAPGWPLLLAPWTAFLGCDGAIGIEVSRVIGVATVLLAALAAHCAGAARWPSVVAAAIVAIHPIHVAWSATGETNVAAAAALLTGLCGTLIYVRTRRRCGAALAVAALGLATAIRPESLLPALAIGAGLAALVRTPARERASVLLGIVFACGVAAFSARQLWTMNESISGGAFLAGTNIARNALRIAQDDARLVHGAVVLLALLGALALVRARQRGLAGLLLAVAVSAAIVALAYDRFHERMLLAATLALAPLIAFAFEWAVPGSRLRRALQHPLTGMAVVALLFLMWRPALRSAAQPTETQLLETRLAARIGALTWPAEALFIAEQPSILSAAGLKVMTTAHALAGSEELAEGLRRGRPIYFLRDMYCEPGFAGAARPTSCNEILERFVSAPTVEETLNVRTYSLYRLLPRSES